MANCSICKNKLTTIKKFGKLPLSNNLLDSENEKTVKYDLTLCYCKDCKLLQLEKKFKSEKLFKKSYPYKSGTSKIFVDHCKEFAKRILEENEKTRRISILEIGGNDGTLALEIVRENKNCGITIVDPCSPRNFDTIRIRSIQALFNKEDFSFERRMLKYDKIIFQNSFAHLPDPKKTISDCLELLADNGDIIIELPVAEYTVDNAFWETVYQEHQFYWSMEALEKFMLSNRMYLKDIVSFPNIQGGSARFYFSRVKPKYTIGYRKINFKKLIESLDRFELRRLQLKRFIRSIPPKNVIVGITASAKAASLLYALDKKEIDRINFLADDTPAKKDKYLACHKRNIPIQEFSKVPENGYYLILSKNYEFLLHSRLLSYKPKEIFCP